MWKPNKGDGKKGGNNVMTESSVTEGPSDPPAESRNTLQSLAEKLGSNTQEKSKLETIKVDGLVLLKIIKHCTESLPELCTGSLLGMDVGSNLEVTNSFPFPNNDEDISEIGVALQSDMNDKNKSDKRDGRAFQHAMLKLLQDINVDCNPVGWYRSTYLGSFCTPELVQDLFTFQDQLDHDKVQKSVFLVYDPFQTKRGNLSLKAYRLTDSFMELYREQKSGSSKVNKRLKVSLSPSVVAAVGGVKESPGFKIASGDRELSSDKIFDELPIEISNAHLFSVLLDELRERNGERLDTDFDRLNLRSNQYLSSNLEFLVEEADNLSNEQQKKNNDKRRLAKMEQEQIKFIIQRRAENAVREERGEPLLPEVDPTQSCFKNSNSRSSSLESLLIEKQISIYTEQINRFSGTSFSKLYLAGAIQGQKID